MVEADRSFVGNQNKEGRNWLCVAAVRHGGAYESEYFTGFGSEQTGFDALVNPIATHEHS